MVLQPRLTAVCGDAYKSLHDPVKIIRPRLWTQPMKELKERLEAKSGVRFTHVLFNLYRNGNDSISWHLDNERACGDYPLITSVSLGAARTFQFRNYDNKKIRLAVELTPGSVLIMKGRTQHCWEQQVPKTKRESVHASILLSGLVNEGIRPGRVFLN